MEKLDIRWLSAAILLVNIIQIFVVFHVNNRRFK